MIFIFLFVILSTYSFFGMQVPVTAIPERRPIEESMFELHAQAGQRLHELEQSVATLENLAQLVPLDSATIEATEKIKRACNDALLQDMVLRTDAKASSFAHEQKEENKRIATDIRLLNTQLTEHKAQQEARLALAVDEQRNSSASVKTDLESLKAQLREQSRQQEQARGQLQAQVVQLSAVNAQLATELEAQKNATKKVYLVGGAVCLVAAGTALYLGARISQHDQDLYGCQSTQNKNESELNKNQSTLGRLFKSLYGIQNEIRSLSDQVAALQQRPYVSKDHNNALVYNAPNGSGPVRGARVSKW